MAYRITDWLERYETHESRKLKKLSWVPVPNQHDGLSFRRLIAMPKGTEIFGAWCLILQVASKMETRGLLVNSSGALDASDLAAMTGANAKLFEAAFEALSSPKIGWIEQLQDNPAKSPGTPADQPGKIPAEPRELRDTVQDITEQGKKETLSTGVDRESLKSVFDEARKAYPGTKRGLEPEWSNFAKKYGKQAGAIIPLLLPAIREAEIFRKDCEKLRAFCPAWKNFQTWINGSHWQDEFPDKIEVSNGR